MAYTTINKSTDYFSSDLWSGNSSTQSINVGKNFSSNGSLIWIKGRNSSGFAHRFIDSVRGKEKLLASNSTDAEFTESGDGIASYSSTGFNLQFSSQNDYNESGGNYVGWNWLAGSSPTGSSNTDGSINTTYTSANTTAGFSISKYTGTGANATVGHGLGVAPAMIIIKDLSESSYDWMIYHQSLGATKYIRLNLTNAEGTSSVWQNTAPTNQVFSVVSNSSDVNKSGNNFIAYCFAEKTGYSNFGSYTGNGSTDGTFVYTGFKPAFFMIKRTDGSGDKWRMWDNKRSPFNLVDDSLACNETSAEYDDTSVSLDFLSNGCKMKMSGGGAGNGSGETYIYMAFAEAPLVGSNNVPCTAR